MGVEANCFTCKTKAMNKPAYINYFQTNLKNSQQTLYCGYPLESSFQDDFNAWSQHRV